MKKLKQSIELSAIVIVGCCRERSQRAVDALYDQTAAASMEIIIVDLADQKFPRLRTNNVISTVIINRSPSDTWAQARAAGIFRARGKIIAFIEDHTIPAKNWAGVLIQVHDDWAAVGYGFINANPESYMSRASMFSDYALWMDPLPSGPANLLPGNNVSYKRDILLSLKENLETELGVDFNIHEALKKRGYSFYLEGRALIAHENYDTLGGLLGANHYYCRLLAANRVKSQSWSLGKRFFYGLTVPVGAPLIKLVRLIRSLRGRRPLWKDFVVTLPVLSLAYFWSAVGESLGYLFGGGASNQEFVKWELNRERISRK